MRLRFIDNATIRVNGELTTLFQKGAVEELNVHSAGRWIRRGVAVEAGADEKPVKAKKKRAKKKAGKK